MTKYTSGRQKNLKIGISSYSENLTSLEVIGNGNFTGVVTASTFFGNASSLTTTSSVNTSGIISAFKFIGDGSGLINVQSSVSGGIVIKSNGAPVGTAGTLDFASGLSVSPVSAGIVTISTNLNYISNSGVSTNVIGGIGSVTELSVSGITTLGITSTTDLTAKQLNVSDITKLGVTSITDVYVSGVGTFLSSGLKIRNPGNSAEYSIVGSAIVADRNLTLPTITSNTGIAVTGLAQSWFGLQTFNSGVNILNGLTIATGTFDHSGSFNFSVTGQLSSTITFGGALGTGLLTFGQSTRTQTTNIQAGASGVGTTKTINFGTGGLSGSFTNINIGPTAGVGTVAINAGTNLGIGSVTPTSALDVIGDAKFTGIVTASSFSGNASSATYATSAGIATYATTAGIATYATSAGIATYATTAGIATYATNAGIATALQNARNFSITGNFVTATAISFDGTGNVSLAATITPDSIGLGTYTTGDYIKSISGTSNQITVTGGIGEGSTPTLSFPNQVTIPQDLTVLRDVQIDRNLNVGGNITIGGTSATISVQTIKVSDSDLILGVRTDAFGNDISNDTTANHGGIAVASTEGSPLVNLNIAGIETLPPTYKKIMWFKAGSFAGLNTDAWLFNYGVGIGSTQFPSGTRLAAGNVQFTQNDLAVIRNINASGGIITATTFNGTLNGNASSATYASNAGVATYASISGISTNLKGGLVGNIPYQSATDITVFLANGDSGTILQSNGVDSAPSWVLPAPAGAITGLTIKDEGVTVGLANSISQLNFVGANVTATASGSISTITFLDYASTAGIATYATNAGIATYATTAGIATYASTSGIATYASTSGIATYASDAGVSTSVIGGIASVSALSVSGVSTLGTVQIYSGIVTATSGIVTYYGDGSKLSGVSAQSGIFVADEGSVLGSGVTTLNFSGPNINVLATTNGIGTVTVNDYVSNAGFSTIAGYATTAGISTNLKGGLVGNIPYQSATDITAFLVNGASGTVLQSNGVGNAPSWVSPAPAGAITGLTIKDEGVTVGLANSITQLDFVGANVTATASGSISTITVSTQNFSGGSFDTNIDNVLYIQPTGTLDIVGVGTSLTQITTLPGGANEYIIHSIHVTNVSNGDAEITAGFIINNRRVPASISVSAGSSGGAGIHTFTVGSASSITVGMAVTGTGNIGETTGIGSTAGFQFNTYVTSVDGNNITLSKPMSGRATGILQFSPVSKVSSRLPVPVGSAVELLKQPMVLNGLDSIVLQSTGAGSGIGSTSTFALHQTANVGFLTVTAGAAITNFISAGMLIQSIGTNTGIQTNTYVGVGYTPGELRIPITRPATTSVASTSYSFTEVVVPQDGALQATIVYQSSTDTAYQNGTGTVVGIVTSASLATSPVLGITSTVPLCYYGTGNTYPSIVQSIRVSNISDGSIYPGGDYPVWVGIGNNDTVFSWLAYNMIIPKNSSIELCESPKRLGIGQSIFAYASTPGTIEIQIAAKQKTT